MDITAAALNFSLMKQSNAMIRSFRPFPLESKRGISAPQLGRPQARKSWPLSIPNIRPSLRTRWPSSEHIILFYVNIRPWQSDFCRPIRRIPIFIYAAVVATKVNSICLYNPCRRPNKSVLRWLTNPSSRFRSRIVTFRPSSPGTSGTRKPVRMLERITVRY